MNVLWILLLLVVGAVFGALQTGMSYRAGRLEAGHPDLRALALMWRVCGVISVTCFMGAGYVWGAM